MGPVRKLRRKKNKQASPKDTTKQDHHQVRLSPVDHLREKLFLQTYLRRLQSFLVIFPPCCFLLLLSLFAFPSWLALFVFPFAEVYVCLLLRLPWERTTNFLLISSTTLRLFSKTLRLLFDSFLKFFLLFSKTFSFLSFLLYIFFYLFSLNKGKRIGQPVNGVAYTFTLCGEQALFEDLFPIIFFKTLRVEPPIINILFILLYYICELRSLNYIYKYTLLFLLLLFF